MEKFWDTVLYCFISSHHLPSMKDKTTGEENKSSPWQLGSSWRQLCFRGSWDMAWGSQVGHGVFWLDINNLAELQPQTRFAVPAMKWDKTHDLFVNLLKHSQKHSPRQTTKCLQLSPTKSESLLLLYQWVVTALICPRGDLLSYVIKELSLLLDSTQSRVNSFSWNPPQN